MFGTDPLDELAIPDGSHVREHDLAVDGDVLVGGQSVVELGVRGGNVVAGERVRIGGDVEADGDCRLDMWCAVDGNVLVGRDAYLGERVTISGQLIVSGDLDIGDDVDIEEGFEANGWIVIRNPMPTIVFLFVYLSQLLRLGEEEAAEEVAATFLRSDREADPAIIPRGARVSDDAWRVSTPATIGDDCRLHGNIRATTIEVGRDSEMFGSLRGKGDVSVGPGTVVHGDVTTKDGDVTVADGAHIRGDISCEDCQLSEAAEVDGAIRARGALNFVSPSETDQEGDEMGDEADDGSTDLEADDDAGLDEEAADEAGAGEEATDEEATDVDDADAEDEDADPEAAVVPLSEGDVDWETLDDRSSNGEREDVEEIIAEAEEG